MDGLFRRPISIPDQPMRAGPDCRRSTRSLVRALRTIGHTTRARTKRSVSSNPPTPLDQTLAQPLGKSLLVERENRVNPGGSQRWDETREYGNHNEEQRCSRYAYGVGWTDVVQQRRDLWGRREGYGEPDGNPR